MLDLFQSRFQTLEQATFYSARIGTFFIVTIMTMITIMIFTNHHDHDNHHSHDDDNKGGCGAVEADRWKSEVEDLSLPAWAQV